jgi:hypothetical protein
MEEMEEINSRKIPKEVFMRKKQYGLKRWTRRPLVVPKRHHCTASLGRTMAIILAHIDPIDLSFSEIPTYR